MNKICNTCHVDKPISGFYKRKGAKDGYRAMCSECGKSDAKEWREKNPEIAAAANYKWASQNREKSREIKRRWIANNREKDAAIHSAWKKANKANVRLSQATRVAAKKRAIPKWADTKEIHSIYMKAVEITESSGVVHHVDHIVPLRGQIVCGLHVPNNLRVIPASENLYKSNVYWPDMP